MAETRRNAAVKNDSNGPSLMYTLHAISRMSKDEIDLLKKLRKSREPEAPLNEDENSILPHILEGFNVKTIQEVLAAVDHFQLFELYDF